MRLSTHSTRPPTAEPVAPAAVSRALPCPDPRRGGRPRRRRASPPARPAGERRSTCPHLLGLEGRTWRHQHAGDAGPSGPFDGHVAGVPGGRPLLLEPSSCSSSTTTAARSRTGAQAAARAPTTVAPAAATAQSRGISATGTPAAPQAHAEARAGQQRGRQHQARCRASPPPARREGVGGGRQAHDRTRPGERLAAARYLPLRGPGRSAGRPAGRDTTRSGEAVRRNGTRRPAHRHAAQPARSIISALGPRPDTLARGRSVTPGAARRRPRSPIRRPGGRGGRCAPGRRPRRRRREQAIGTR